ncbi:unnamed protein product [Rhizoctonia solani]|uniref:Uncharacterized protein n=1 Tax=Rhizoctonia solani TaxID=456999 RepID=A0A8H2ZZV7_9AGAM|nr:unnamed protein product [Rhizoctonia solani]
MFHGDLRNRLKPNTTFAICDAGESIVDTTIYGVTLARPVLELEEKQAPASVLAGSIFVDCEAERYLNRTLSGAELSSEDVEECTKAGVKDFKSVLKWSFIDETADHLIQIGPIRCKYPSSIRVRRDHMVISGERFSSPVVKGFFDACVNEIIASVDKQLEGFNVQNILLIGEFANSPYLRQVFQKRYEPRGSRILFVDNYSSPTAAAEGGVVYVRNVMTMQRSAKRAPRFSWGIETSIAFNYDDLDHRDRKTQVSTSGRTLVPGRWHGVAQKGVVIDEGDIVRTPVSLDFPSLPSELGEFKLDLYHYSRDDEPVWMRNKQGGLLPKFSKAVHIYTNLSDLRGALNPRIDRDGTLQYQLNFDICMRFGGVELVAYSEWEEERTTRTGRCTLVPTIDQA